MRGLRRLGWLALAVAAGWFSGLALFVVGSLMMSADPPGRTDAIVVLTGGRLRLETGLDLLAKGDAKKLFISGVNPQVNRAALLRVMGPAAEREACCIVLGHQADDTYGNARETAGWMHEEGYASLRLVTSWYHMRRAMLEFGRTMPRLRILASPVFAHHIDPERIWGWHGAAMLVIGEYHKYLAALARPVLDRIVPALPGPPPHVQTTAQRNALQ